MAWWVLCCGSRQIALRSHCGLWPFSTASYVRTITTETPVAHNATPRRTAALLGKPAVAPVRGVGEYLRVSHSKRPLRVYPGGAKIDS